MVARTYHCQDLGDDSGKKPFRFSGSLVKKMAAHLEKRLGQPVSLGDADQALQRLTEFFQTLLEHRKKNGDAH